MFIIDKEMRFHSVLLHCCLSEEHSACKTPSAVIPEIILSNTWIKNIKRQPVTLDHLENVR